MDLVVVYLTDVGKHIIVPESYVYGLDLKQLKNRGKNMCRNHLVYWSDDCIEGERYPEPNETAPKSKTFPAGGGAWYLGRTIHFTDSFDDAKTVKEKRRHVKPPVYNSARLSEKPLPLLVLVNESNSLEVEEDDENGATSNANNDDNVAGAVDPLMQLNLSDDADDNSVEENNEIGDEMSSSGTVIENDNTTTSNVSIAVSLGSVLLGNRRSDDSLDEQDNNIDNEIPSISDDKVNDTSTQNVSNKVIEDIAATNENNDGSIAGAVGALLQLNQRDDTNNGDNPLHQQIDELPSNSGVRVKQEPIYNPLNEEEAQAIDIIFNHSYEQCDSDGEIYVEKSTPIPAPATEAATQADNPYQMKTGDIISGNIPFATEDGSGNRAYIASLGTDFKQVNLTSRIVSGLTPYNMHGFRDCPIYDKKFIKILMIAILEISEIRNNRLDPIKMSFIKDLFEIRSGGKRMHQFDKIVDVCRREISNRNYVC